jgi:hypothetical protein
MKKIGDLFEKSKNDPRLEQILQDAAGRIQGGRVQPGNSTSMELGESLGGLEGNDAGIDPKLATAFEIIRQLVQQVKELGGAPDLGNAEAMDMNPNVEALEVAPNAQEL